MTKKTASAFEVQTKTTCTALEKKVKIYIIKSWLESLPLYHTQTKPNTLAAFWSRSFLNFHWYIGIIII